nr:MAG TPA: hypothetical protein [Caudoviricetes sp.]
MDIIVPIWFVNSGSSKSNLLIYIFLYTFRLYLHHISYYQIYNASRFHSRVLYSLLHIDISSILYFR